jgi:hypothetical protein
MTGRRNPIKRHGGNPYGKFAQIPNDVIRDGTVSDAGYRLLSVIYSHADGYEVSVASMADALGRDRKNTGRVLKALAETRWLAIQHVITSEGKRAYETYHVHAARKFTEAEWLEYSATVTLRHKYSRPCGEMPHPPEAECPTPMGLDASPKNTNLKDQVEEQREHPASQDHSDPYCQDCENAACNVCSLHFHDRTDRYREPVSL